MADINNEVLNFSFTVEQTNALLSALGGAPFMQVAQLIGLIQSQGGPQVEKLQAAADGDSLADAPAAE
jgi:hypothetical protein